MHSADFRIFRPLVIEDDYLYQVRSWPDTVLEPELSAWRRRIELELPDGANPRTRRLAAQIAAESASPAEAVERVLNLFTREPFVYTLQPPLLPERDRMDAFLFDTRRGFCEHYAAAFVIMMRAAGIPARVVAGYQGGEVNPVNGTVIVHQFDAHAWSEVWLEGRGWVRVDPTAAVAPERIELGLEEALAEEGSFLPDSPLSPLRYRKIDIINKIRLRYDALTYSWQAWVVGFDADKQFDLLKGFFGDFSARKFAAVLLGSWALVLVPVAWVLLLRRKTHALSRLDRLYLNFCRRLESMGVARKAGEAPRDYALRAQRKIPRLAEQIADVTKRYDQLAYAEGASQDGELGEFARAVRSIR